MPLLERVCERDARVRVALCQLADERPDRAAAAGAALDLQRDEGVEPRADGLPPVERRQVAEHAIGVVGDDGAQQRAAVLEVVIELALAGAGALDDVVDARLGDPALVDELRCGGDDPLARRASSGGLRGSDHGVRP